MVFVWLLILADVHLIVRALEPTTLYGLKLDTRQGLSKEAEYTAIYAQNDQINGSLPLIIDNQYDIIFFGQFVVNREFVLTKGEADKGVNCNSLGTTPSRRTKQIDNSDDNITTAEINLSFNNNDVQQGRYYFCFHDGVEGSKKYLHAGTDSFQSIYFIAATRSTILPVGLQIAFISVLLCLSGTFSGLNLGLMALDPQQLKILQTAGSPNEQKYAKAVLPVRQYGNFLLCTLLLGNVLVNNTLTIFLDDMTSGMVAIIGSTAGIVIFGEIIPQAFCSRHGLFIGYRTLPLTYLFMGVTGLISWPLGKLLDIVLGEEVGMSYNKHRFLEIVKQAQNDLEDDEKQMIEGALKLNEKTVHDVMTQINYVFSVTEDAIIDYEFMQKLSEAGYSRIPVTKKADTGIGEITGLLFLRDLVMVDPDDRIEVSTVTNYYKHQLKKIDELTKLDDMLEIFKNGAYHLSLVTRQIDIGNGKKETETVGIITLEDIIEEIICDEIVDETDKYVNNKSRERNTKREKMDPEFMETMRNNANNVQGNPMNPDRLEEISRNQISAVHRFLVSEVKPFSPHLIVENQLKNLINRIDSIVYVKKNSNIRPLIEIGKPITHFIVIVEGKADLCFGKDDMPIEVGCFRCFGVSALLDLKQAHGSLLKATNKGSQSIPNGVINSDSFSNNSRHLSDDFRGGSCPPSTMTTPATTPVSQISSGIISNFTLTVTSDEFIYIRISRADYRHMRNQMEIRNAQKVSSMETIPKTGENTTGFEPESTGNEARPELSASSDAICQNDYTEDGETKKLLPK